tara:strand:- start:461 stop:706 length:246 start_codon:yes stop_codon:yes gene_type:complete
MKREFRELGSKADDDKWVWTAEKNKFMEDMAECVSSLTKRVIDLELLLAKLADREREEKKTGSEICCTDDNCPDKRRISDV